jgi:hypothetical protein
MIILLGLFIEVLNGMISDKKYVQLKERSIFYVKFDNMSFDNFAFGNLDFDIKASHQKYILQSSLIYLNKKVYIIGHIFIVLFDNNVCICICNDHK